MYDLLALTFPPESVARCGIPAVQAFLLAHHHPLKMLIMIMTARHRRMRRPPAELWALIRDEHFMNLMDS